MAEKMRVLIKIIFTLSLVTIIFGQGCQSKKSTAKTGDWPEILEKVIVAARIPGPDSLRYTRIQDIFDQYNITAADYKKFYDRYVEQNPVSSISLLEQVEKLMSENMQKAQQEKKKAQEEERRKILEQMRQNEN